VRLQKQCNSGTNPLGSIPMAGNFQTGDQMLSAGRIVERHRHLAAVAGHGALKKITTEIKICALCWFEQKSLPSCATAKIIPLVPRRNKTTAFRTRQASRP
jgi:hypothetical protein